MLVCIPHRARLYAVPRWALSYDGPVRTCNVCMLDLTQASLAEPDLNLSTATLDASLARKEADRLDQTAASLLSDTLSGGEEVRWPAVGCCHLGLEALARLGPSHVVLRWSVYNPAGSGCLRK